MTEQLIDLNGARLHLAQSGAGRPVLLLPGGAGTSDYLEPVAHQLHDDATVYRLEPRGCGESTRDGRYDLATTLADLEALRTYLGIDRWVVGGHSHGAFYALAYALTHPDRTEGILYLAGVGLQSDRSWSAAYDAGLAAGLDREVPEGMYSFNQEPNTVANAEFKAYVRQPSLWRDISQLDRPLRAVSGEADIRPIWPVEQLVATLPDAQLEVIPGAPHDFWYTHPAELGEILRRQLSTI